MRFSARFLVFGLALLYFIPEGTAQRANEVFGKNRIQYRSFDWVYISGENFDVYYYDGRRAVATEALQYLESEFDRITDLIGYAPYYKARIFLYNSLADQRQSNVGLNRTEYTVNGEIEFVKPYIEVSYPGTSQEFKRELLYKVSDLMINEMMYGGNLKEIFQSALLMNLSEWFVKGASEYVAKGWTSEMDDYVREIIRSKRVNKIFRLTGREAAVVGQSFWNFIAEKYGKSSISNILNYTRITRKEEQSVLITLGVSYKQVLREWQQYYSEMESQVSKSYINHPDSTKLRLRHNSTTQFTTLKVSPDGKYVAYAENDRGRYIVKVRSLLNGKETTILTHGSKVISQEVDYRLPIIGWSDASTLGVIAVRNGEYTFWLYDMNTHTKLPRELDKFNNVRSISFSSNGRLAVLSADYEGKNDLYLISSRRDRIRRLTNDAYDDLDPSFIPNTNKIVFSSNRTTDSLNSKVKVPLSSLTDVYHLYVFDLDTTKAKVQQITNTVSKDVQPIALNNNVFYYLSDQRGIVNLFKYDRSNGIYTQITNFSSGIENYDLNIPQSTLAMVTNRKMRDEMHVHRGFNMNRQIFTPSTRRKELQQSRIIREKRQQQENKNMSLKDLINSRLEQSKKDTLATADSLKTEQPVPDTVKTKTAPVVNTDNYVFEDEAVKETQPSESFLNRYVKARDKAKILGPFPYESRFSADNMITAAVIDPIRGWGGSFHQQMNDMLENYRFLGGFMTSLDFRNGDFYAEAQYLPKLVDFSLRFDRKGIRKETFVNDIAYKYALNRLEFGASLPISERIRFSVKPFGAFTRSVHLGRSLTSKKEVSPEPVNNFYAGLRSEFVYDNSIATAMNITEGTRVKVSYVHYQGLNDSDKSFSQVSADVRHYQKIYKTIIFAVRGFGGSFYGNSPKQYLLGGMENWAFNDSKYGGITATGERNPLGLDSLNEDILFAEFATNLRGFDYATLFGNNVLLLNAELRIPIVQVFTNSPITSTFLRHLQFIGFYDIGTSWSGRAPFGENGSVNYDEIVSKPFEVRIKNYLNPWLYSYGVGMRSTMLGYYLKVDVAWPVKNYEVGNPSWLITLGFDF
ncbi:MAG: PD40 domain-containing protein [Cyclobacteriaceae bacterium]|nr:PD40 domain-containing protein [Cyclobacteriaceae bacterium]